MLISIKEVKKIDEFSSIPENTLKRKLDAIEQAIRQVANNNFQNRLKRIVASSSDNKLNGTSPYFKKGDTIQISEGINSGLYVIEAIDENTITFDKEIYDSESNLCTKIEYPADVIEGALKVLSWDLKNAEKSGVASESETLSRHSYSITYKSYDSTNTIGGYPEELFNFCRNYGKARF